MKVALLLLGCCYYSYAAKWRRCEGAFPGQGPRSENKCRDLAAACDFWSLPSFVLGLRGQDVDCQARARLNSSLDCVSGAELRMPDLCEYRNPESSEALGPNYPLSRVLRASMF